MAKIFSVLTLIIAGVAAYLGLESQKLVDELQKKGAAQYTDLLRTRKILKQTQDDLATMTADRDRLKTELEETKEKLRKTEEDLSKTKTDLQTSQAELEKAKGELAAIQKVIDEAIPGGAGLEGIGKLKESITMLTNKTKEQEAAIVELEKKKTDLEAKVADLEGTKKSNEERIASQGTVIKRYTDNVMQKGIQGRVMAVNSGWGFCVVSIGDKSGAANNKMLVVARGGQAIGKVKITNVEANQSVADILPGTFLKGMYVQPGDQVIFTGEDKVKVEEDLAKAAGIVPALPKP